MKKLIVVILILLLPITEAAQVKLVTNYGDILVELFPKKAPITVANFVSYVEKKRYDGTIIHRVSKGHVIQGGGFTKQYEPIETDKSIANEAINGLSNTRGTIAMARFDDKDSADSQFFINLADNTHLNHRNDTNVGYGYAVFGKVIEGMSIVDDIAKIPTGFHEEAGDEVPAYPVIVQRVELLKK
ncbi:MAG: peptidylprolyl isomerase [Kangiellaceae bacterium]|jgi:cyclophilin family peptidyl-prolyl cis-trans isomerase|nr:peptidylprolyl isomerase [Kangiellaceae bacterium]